MIKRTFHTSFVFLFTFQLLGQVQIVITSLPEKNPENLRIYLTGNFNEWKEGDAQFELKKNDNGLYAIQLDATNGPEIEFKFMAGSWDNIESNSKFFPRPNRKINTLQTSYYEAKIDNWQELSRGFGTDLYVFTILFAILLSSLFLFLINKYHKRILLKHFVLPVLIVLSAISVGIIFFKYNSFLWQNYLDVLKWIFVLPYILSLFYWYKEDFNAYHELKYVLVIASILCFLLLLTSFSSNKLLNSNANYISLLIIEFNPLCWALFLFLDGKKETVKVEVIESVPKPEFDNNLLVAAFEKLMLQEKAYLNNELTLEKLAAEMGLHRNMLSKIINDHYQLKFNDFINELRIKEFIRIANDPETFHQYTYFGLAQQVGFNSKSAFNRAFKKITEKTPTEYFKTSSKL